MNIIQQILTSFLIKKAKKRLNNEELEARWEEEKTGHLSVSPILRLVFIALVVFMGSMIGATFSKRSPQLKYRIS